MSKSKAEIIQTILNNFKPEPYIKKIRCGMDANLDGTIVLRVEFSIERSKLGDREVNKPRLLAHTKELANRIRRETKLPISATQTTVKYV
jgi:hypothetical protein